MDKECERCKEIGPTKTVTIFVDGQNYAEYELCDACIVKFEDFTEQ